MTKLVLGVIDIPYRHPKPSKGKGKPEQGKTTGDVAEILEAKYHPMESFWQIHEKQNIADLTRSLEGALESTMMGAPTAPDPFIAGLASIESRFKKFINDGEMERLGYPGVPTQAALKGVNPRLAHPYAKSNPRRPSFIATGLYIANFKAWISDK